MKRANNVHDYEGGFEGVMPMGVAPHKSLQTAYRNSADSIQSLTHDLQTYQHSLNKVMEHVSTMAAEAYSLRHHYEEVNGEREYLSQLVKQTDERLKDVKSIIDRYTVVKDAVVASDGYTYERDTITSYIKNCKQAGNTPQSQQTEEQLTSLLIPNRSLAALLERLVELQKSDGVAESGGHAKSGSAGTNTRHGGGAAAGSANEAAGGNHSGNVNTRGGGHANFNKDSQIEANALGERLHPCLRVYGLCNYRETCAYAKYPYDACLSNLKGKCRFRNQCHERHVEFRGPLNDKGVPVDQEDVGAKPASNNIHKEKPAAHAEGSA